MTAIPLSRLDAAAIAALPTAAVEPTAVAIATEIDRLEALLAALERRLAATPTNPQRDTETLYALP
jgi:hypothetical protein